MTLETTHQLAETIPESVFCLYELAFAIITTGIIIFPVENLYFPVETYFPCTFFYSYSIVIGIVIVNSVVIVSDFSINKH